ncbi:NAD-dependent epimerase [Acetomicrobium sp.]|uniref:NAD-dependent epimerase n=1 Tax=Acetomicrobium sp. TaxID=1872099 RepID=UPI00235B6762|nr:NAD-dependent epimerase [Acetomicrobium sp.]
MITGAAGFIGFHLAKFMLERRYFVVGLDNLNSYYDPKLKEDRLDILRTYNNFVFYRADLKEKPAVEEVFAACKPEYVVNLAAQAGVRYSLENPYAYVDSNLVGFVNVLEACRSYPVKHLLFASSSSIYGGNKTVPFSTEHNTDHPVSLYAATKKANELMAHTYAHLYGIPSTGVRLFTVYGPWGRPDMAYFSFTRDILAGVPIKVFNHGRMSRDFTYIDDVVKALYHLIDLTPKPNPDWNEKAGPISESFAPYKIYNLGNNSPVELSRFIAVLENCLGKKAQKVYLDMQPGDVIMTYADVADLEKAIGFKPETPIEEGLAKFVEWYRKYYKV